MSCHNYTDVTEMLALCCQCRFQDEQLQCVRGKKVELSDLCCKNLVARYKYYDCTDFFQSRFKNSRELDLNLDLKCL